MPTTAPSAPVALATPTVVAPTPRELFDANLPLARVFATVFHRRMPRSIAADELHAAALTGLWDAAQTHAAKAKGRSFRTYAYLCCRRSMIDWLRTSRPIFWLNKSRKHRPRNTLVLSGLKKLPLRRDYRQDRERELRELRDEVEVALQSLRELPRRRLRAYYLEGLTMVEIAEREGLCGAAISVSIGEFVRRGGKHKVAAPTTKEKEPSCAT